MLAISLTVVLTLLAIVVYANLTSAAPAIGELPEIEVSLPDQRFHREVAAHLDSSLTSGNRVEIFHNGVEIFPAMLKAIRDATLTITFENYVFWQGDITREFAEALAERARAGVRVHVIFDAVGSAPMDDSLADLMRRAGVELSFYRPLSWYQIDRFNHRTHRRALVVDGRIGFTGGVGIAKEWTGDAQDGDHYREMHFRIEGPAVAQLQGAFSENWRKCGREILLGEGYFPDLEPAGETTAMIVASAPGTGNEHARQLHLLAISAARESLVIGTPYFVPDDLLLEALLAASRRGVKIQVLVPGRANDSLAARYASRSKWGELLKAGVEIYEYRRTLYHCKLMIVDGYWSIVGSTNFDSRSFRLNDEINLSVLGEDLASELRRAFNADLQPAKRIEYATWSSRPLHERALELMALVIQGQV